YFNFVVMPVQGVVFRFFFFAGVFALVWAAVFYFFGVFFGGGAPVCHLPVKRPNAGLGCVLGWGKKT
ncbi:hypothetical protein ACVGWX_00405, partial [Enterobacter hormaechei]